MIVKGSIIRAMNKQKWIILWSSRFIMLSGVICLLEYFWAFYGFQNYSGVWYYYVVHLFLILITTFGVLIGFSIISVKDGKLIVYRIFKKTVFETVCISFGRKKELGTGARSISHYPIYLTGTVLQKGDQTQRKSMMLICGYISNKVFSKFYKKQLAPILKNFI